MQTWMILGICAFMSVGSAFVSALVLVFLGRRQLIKLTEAVRVPAAELFVRIAAIEKWQADADAEVARLEQEEESEKMSALGKRSQEVQAERREEAAQITQEAESIILDKSGIEEKKTALLGLLQAHPQVALSIAQKLNRKFGIAKAVGMKEIDFLNMVQDLAQKALSSKKIEGPASTQGNFYGL